MRYVRARRYLSERLVERLHLVATKVPTGDEHAICGYCPVGHVPDIAHHRCRYLSPRRVGLWDMSAAAYPEKTMRRLLCPRCRSKAVGQIPIIVGDPATGATLSYV